jgi:NAD(P)H-dependent flavin oxidoreductase YrpB (nitropropane dioxygenase family)
MKGTRSPLGGLGVSLPVLAAPLAGGPTTPDLVIAAGHAGGAGFLAAGYKTRNELAGQISLVRASGVPFGVNLFAPNPVPVSLAEYGRYADAIRTEADRYGVTLAREPIEDDDAWADKVDLLLEDPVPMVSFTFGIPRADVIKTLRRAGTLVIQTVTSVEEARLAATTGVDMLVVQCSDAGGHLGTLTPQTPPAPTPIADLVGAVRDVTGLPVLAAGGISTAREIAAVLGAGAAAAAVGTILLRSTESGASNAYRAALADTVHTETVVTRAFTGRPARALRNHFTDTYGDRAPLGYPAVHHLTSPLRKAAAAAGDAERVNLWAGTGFRRATAEPAADILRRLASPI